MQLVFPVSAAKLPQVRAKQPRGKEAPYLTVKNGDATPGRKH